MTRSVQTGTERAQEKLGSKLRSALRRRTQMCSSLLWIAQHGTSYERNWMKALEAPTANHISFLIMFHLWYPWFLHHSRDVTSQKGIRCVFCHVYFLFLFYKGTRLAIWNGICSTQLLSVIQKWTPYISKRIQLLHFSLWTVSFIVIIWHYTVRCYLEISTNELGYMSLSKT